MLPFCSNSVDFAKFPIGFAANIDPSTREQTQFLGCTSNKLPIIGL
jgi:hypothetical protein